MAQLLVRDVPQEVVDALKRRAVEHGRSAEAEHRAILERALAPQDHPFWEQARKLREEIGPVEGDSADIIREMRDARHSE